MALDLLTDAELRAAARADLDRRRGDYAYVSPLPPDQRHPIDLPEWLVTDGSAEQRAPSNATRCESPPHRRLVAHVRAKSPISAQSCATPLAQDAPAARGLGTTRLGRAITRVIRSRPEACRDRALGARSACGHRSRRSSSSRRTAA